MLQHALKRTSMRTLLVGTVIALFPFQMTRPAEAQDTCS
jgi:hypothetical protein